MVTLVLAVLVGIVAGAVVGAASVFRVVRMRDRELQQARVMEATANARAHDAADALADKQREIDSVREAKDAVEHERADLQARLVEVGANSKALDDQVKVLTQARQSLTDAFELVASKIFDTRAKMMNEQSNTGLEAVLKPLREKLGEFQGKVEALQQQQVANAAKFSAELTHFGEVSQGMTREAANLTHALTTQSQVRGAWGEQVLARVLEVAGLREGHDYVTQEVHRQPDGTLPRPDVVVNLPQDRRVVVDSKLSLVDYVEYTNAEESAAREEALKQHVAAVRQHVKELSDKDYTRLMGQGALDFVIAFVPIEQAYLAAVEADNTLYDEAWKRHVLFACPSTLLYVLRLVSYLWKQDAQAKHWADIAKRGADLYDKFAGFACDLEAVGAQLEKAQLAYKGATAKLSTGKGSLVRQVEMLKKLGVQPKKQIPRALLDESEGASSQA